MFKTFLHFNLYFWNILHIFAKIEKLFTIQNYLLLKQIGMKTKQERIENIKRLIKRKESIRVKHLLAVKKHLEEVNTCESYIEKYKEILKKLNE